MVTERPNVTQGRVFYPLRFSLTPPQTTLLLVPQIHFLGIKMQTRPIFPGLYIPAAPVFVWSASSTSRLRQAARCAGIPLDNSWTPPLHTHKHAYAYTHTHLLFITRVHDVLRFNGFTRVEPCLLKLCLFHKMIWNKTLKGNVFKSSRLYVYISRILIEEIKKTSSQIFIIKRGEAALTSLEFQPAHAMSIYRCHQSTTSCLHIFAVNFVCVQHTLFCVTSRNAEGPSAWWGPL